MAGAQRQFQLFVLSVASRARDWALPPLRALGTSFSVSLLLFVGGTHAYGSDVSPPCLPLLTVSSDCSGSVFLVFCSTSCVHFYFIFICACTLYIDIILYILKNKNYKNNIKITKINKRMKIHPSNKYSVTTHAQ